MTILKITVGQSDAIKEQARERLAAVEAGAEVDDAQPVLNFESYASMDRLLSETNLQLLETIAEYEPSSMRETADLVDRDIKDVHKNLSELEQLNIVEFEQEGRSKRPIVRYDTIEIEVSFPRGEPPAGSKTGA